MRHLLPYRYIDAIARAGSIRKAAETLAITPSALNRRLLAVEQELGVEIFERLPAGVRLNVAGEILLEHIRNQMSDLERVKSRIADLSGARRGSVSIVCTAEAIGPFLSEQLAIYRAEHPGVTFRIDQRIRGSAERALGDYSADIALLFEPENLTHVQVLHSSPQPIQAVLAAGHPLSGRAELRLYECLDFPILLPDEKSGLRRVLEALAGRLGVELRPALQSASPDLVWRQMTVPESITFRAPVDMPADVDQLGLVIRPLVERGAVEGTLFAGQLRGRTLPVASARFMEQLIAAMAVEFDG